MSPENLAVILGQAYHNAALFNESLTVAACLFGVRYVDEINECGVNPEKLCELAGITKLGPTINLGMRLSRHIEITNYDSNLGISPPQ